MSWFTVRNGTLGHIVDNTPITAYNESLLNSRGAGTRGLDGQPASVEDSGIKLHHDGGITTI